MEGIHDILPHEYLFQRKLQEIAAMKSLLRSLVSKLLPVHQKN